MARPLSEEKRQIILDSAAKIIAEEGLAAPTSRIAKEAGVAEGTVFNYFASKERLYNQLYLELKSEVAQALLSGYPFKANLPKRTRHIWAAYVNWAVRNSDKRKAMRQLSVSNYITAETRQSIDETLSEVASLLESLVKKEHGLSTEFIAAMMATLAETTVDFMAGDPKKADEQAEAGFKVFWRAVQGR